jgi:hypothetical protein
MAASLKNLETKCTTLSDDLFLCQVSKESTVRFPRNVLDKIDAEEKSGTIRIIIITRIAIAKQLRTSPYPMAPNSKNDDDHQFARARSTWKPNFAQIGGFFYFGGHFGFKMVAIGNQNRRHMVQHVLLPVNIHFH